MRGAFFFLLLSLLTSCEHLTRTLEAWYDDAMGLEPPEPLQAPSIPKRPANALTGSAFLSATMSLSKADREVAIIREFEQGNVPDFIRRLQPIIVRAEINGIKHKGVVWVTPDYLSIGSDKDFVRIPMIPAVAQLVADRYGFILPTKKLVDEIYEQAKITLSPIALPSTADMVTNGFYAKHNATIESQLDHRRHGDLIAGHKKDLVLTNRLLERPQREAIYGWHQSKNEVIQSLSIFHVCTYADYSHGVRLVHKTMLLDGEETLVANVLQDPVLSALLSDEGPLRVVRFATNCVFDCLMSTGNTLQVRPEVGPCQP